MSNMKVLGYVTFLFVNNLYSYVIASEKESDDVFRTFDIESLCKYNTDQPEVFMGPFTVAQFKFGTMKEDYQNQIIHKCKIKIMAQGDFGLAVAIEEMDIRGKPGDCSDYIQFISYGKSFVQRFLGKLDIDSLSQSSSELLCGQKSFKGPLHSSNQVTAANDKANSFYTNLNTLYLVYHESERQQYNNSFSIIVTLFGQGSGRGRCDDMYQCLNSQVMCIHPNLTCDGHVNCAVPGGGSDEIGCDSNDVQELDNPISIVMITLATMAAFILGMCAIMIIIRQFRKETHSERRADEPWQRRVELNDSIASEAPAYESVISNYGQPPKSGDLPPSYDTLFPQEDVKNS